ncbi:MAG: 3-deoxy-7-phosphoheptulonate synthase, partial [Gammaproteobacteria bacterium]
MRYQTDDLRIGEIKEVIAPAEVLKSHPISDKASETVAKTRQAVHDILTGKDDRLLVVIGPCSIHDPKAALEYANKLNVLREELA